MKLKSLYISILIALLFSCADDTIENQARDTKDQIRFGIAFDAKTRVSTDAQFRSRFEAGDEIGIFAVRKNAGTTASLQEGDNYYHNIKLTCQQNGAWLPETAMYYLPDGEVLDFYAYHPYNVLATNPSQIGFEVQTDQSTATGYSKSDLLAATPAKDVAKGKVVQLDFKHMLSMVQVEVPMLEANGVILKGVGPRETLAMELPKLKTNAVFNLAAQSLATGSKEATIKPYRIEQATDANYAASYTYRILLPAQELTASQAVSYHQDGKDYKQDLAATTLKQGVAKKMTLNMPPTSIHTNLIEAGKVFVMGFPDDFQINGDSKFRSKPRHYVQLTKNYRMAIYTITASQYAAFLNLWNQEKPHDKIREGVHYNTEWNSNHTWFSLVELNASMSSIERSKTPIELIGGKWHPRIGFENKPMCFLSFHGAKAYANWIGGNLPTEAQWEYACRAGTTTLWYFSDDKNDTEKINQYSWSRLDEPLAERLGPKEVGLKGANPWGIYDMHGNVFEMCLDFYDYEPEWNWHTSLSSYPTNTIDNPRIDPLMIVNKNDGRITRGGSWLIGGGLSAFKRVDEDEYRSSSHGVRLIFNE